MPTPDLPPDLTADVFGPWRDDCSPTERAFYFGLLCAFAHSYCGGDNPASAALTRAAFGGSLDRTIAWDTVMTLPTLPRRKVLGSFARRVQPESRKITNGKARGAA